MSRTDPHAQIIAFWCDTYQGKVGAAYPFRGGKDGKTIKDLRALYSDDDLRTYMQAFFDLRDPFLAANGHSLPLFRGMLPKVIAFAHGRQKLPGQQPTYTRWDCPHLAPCDNRGQCANAKILGRPLRVGAV